MQSLANFLYLKVALDPCFFATHGTYNAFASEEQQQKGRKGLAAKEAIRRINTVFGNHQERATNLVEAHNLDPEKRQGSTKKK